MQFEWVKENSDLADKKPTKFTSYFFTAALTAIMIPHLILFLAFGMTPLVINTLICLVLTLCSFVLIHKGPDIRYILVNILQVFLFMFVNVALLGTAYGFQLYCFAMIASSMLANRIVSSRSEFALPTILSMLFFIIYFIVSSLWFVEHEPLFSFHNNTIVMVLYSINALASIASFAFLMAIYMTAASRLSGQLSSEAHHDELTGLFNRRGFYPILTEAYELGSKKEGTCFLAMLDIDHFKFVNDIHGHETGDEALSAIAGLLRTYTKHHRGLQIARWGGEEFLFILDLEKDSIVDNPGANVEGTYAAVFEFFDDIRQEISRLVIKSDGASIALAATIGIADLAERDTLDAAISLADKRLYAGKSAGRNQVVFGSIAA